MGSVSVSQENSGPRILIIDDDDGIRDIAEISLQTLAEWQVFKASSGPVGLDLARRTQPHAILLDVMMPVQDGTETLRQLLEDDQISHIPVIFLTAKARYSERQELLELGCAGVITKPFEVHKLVPQICQILDWSIPF